MNLASNIMVSFNNLEIAYKVYSNNELKKANFLFRLMSNVFVVKAGKLLLNISLFLHLPVNLFIKKTIFKHFCGGETLEEAVHTIEILKKFKVKSIFDFSVEGDETEKGFQHALDETIRTIEFASKHKDEVPFTVFKPSAFGARELLTKASSSDELSEKEKIELEKFRNRIDNICQTAYRTGIPVMIDAEHSYYQQIIDEVCEEMMEKYNGQKAIVFNTLQMYRTNRLEFLETMLRKANEKNYFIGIKFVRGAYMEKERDRALQMNYVSPIYPDKKATDEAFDKALLFSIKNIHKISIFCGTHNEESSLYLTELMAKEEINPNDSRVWFSQLYGMGNHISFNLAFEGYNVAKYIPYGPIKHVLPYLIRRTEENTSVKGQTSRELKLISLELKRRKVHE